MAHRTRLIFSIFCTGFLLLSCEEDIVDPPVVVVDDQLSVELQPMFGGEILYLDSTYSTVEGYDVQFTDLKMIGENIRNGSKQLKDAALFDYREKGKQFFTFTGKVAEMGTLTANLGVQASLNNSDPSAFPNESVLNISNSGGLHWGWSSGYIFMKVEAKVDTIPDGNPLFDHTVVFHIGQNVNLQTLSFSGINWQLTAANAYRFPLKLDMARFLQNGAQTIDLKTEYTSHTAPGQEVLSLKVIENFKAAISEF